MLQSTYILIQMKKLLLASSLIILFCQSLYAQGGSIYTREGLPILSRRQVVNNCLTSLHKNRNDSTALYICECQVAQLNGYFTAKQYRQHKSAGVIDIGSMIEEDSVLKSRIRNCITSTGKTTLLKAESFEDEFVADCKRNIYAATEKKPDEERIDQFCRCQLQMVKTKKLTDAQMETLSNPNSLLFVETMYTCGDPFRTTQESDNHWRESYAADVSGPASDTIPVVSIYGMSYIKVKTGSLTQIWLFDTGASDLLINNDMEKTLKEEGVITNENYLGTGEYEMANGVVDTCRKYRINNVRIGSFSLNNIVVAVTDKGKRIIVGKALLNKFSNWTLDNRKNYLVLTK